GGSLGVDPFRLTQRRSPIDDRLLVLIHPLHPRIHSLLLLLHRRAFHHLLELGTRGHVEHHKFLHRRSPFIASEACKLWGSVCLSRASGILVGGRLPTIHQSRRWRPPARVLIPDAPGRRPDRAPRPTPKYP